MNAITTVFTLSGAARELGIPEVTLRRFIDIGIVTAQRDSANRRVFTRAALELAREAVAERKQAHPYGR